jgi:hypothetical protein
MRLIDHDGDVVSGDAALQCETRATATGLLFALVRLYLLLRLLRYWTCVHCRRLYRSLQLKLQQARNPAERPFTCLCGTISFYYEFGLCAVQGGLRTLSC